MNFKKEEIIISIRDFFYRKNFREVVVPIFHTSLPLEPNIYAFKIGNYYLPTSPEATLKKAIAKGAGNCFAIGHTFRDMEGISPIHSPEFLMLEWYREDADYRKIMEECRELILSIHKALCKRYSCKGRRGGINLNTRWRILSMVDLYYKYTKLDMAEIIDERKMLSVAKKRGYKIKDATWEQLFNQIFLNEIESHLPKTPFFLIDYPARISPLCAKRVDKPYLAERFELYINGIEIANGNTESTDAEGILRGMKSEEKYRKTRQIICPPIDMEFIYALKKMNGKSYAGIGLGIERLGMVLANIEDIRGIK